MNRNRLLFLLAAATLVFAPPLQAQKRSVTILHVTDTHSHLDAIGPRDAAMKGTIGGIAKATTVLNQQRALYPDAIVLHAGDVFQGDVFFNFTLGVPELQWLRKMNFDAVALGNHDLDFGPQYLGQVGGPALGETPVPFLSANSNNLAALGLGSLVRPAIVRFLGEPPTEEYPTNKGVMVGVFGLTVPDDPLCQAPAGMLDPGIAKIARREVASLIDQGAEIIVLLSHLGLAQDELLAQAVEGIDLVISGHSHTTLEKPIEVLVANGRRKSYIVASSPFYANIGRTEMVLDRGAARVASYKLLPLDADVVPDPEVEAQVEALKAEIETYYGPIFSRQIGETNRALDTRPRAGSGFRDSEMGNFVADALRFAGHTDLGLTTAGLISEGLPAGPLVAADLFRPVSYGFDEGTGLGFGLVTANITGQELIKALEVSLLDMNPDDPFFPSVSGVSIAYSPTGGVIEPSRVRVGNEPIDLGRTYTITVNAAVAAFCPLLGVELTDVTVLPDMFEFNAMVNYVTELRGNVEAPALGRIRALRERRQPESQIVE